MTGDSDFTLNLDELELEKEEYRKKANWYYVRGIPLAFSMVFAFVISFFVPTINGFDVFPLALICGLGLTIFGFYIAGYKGYGTSRLIYGCEILERIGPPYPIFKKPYAILKFNDVYFFADGWSGHIYAVAFRGTPQLTDDRRSTIPSMFYRRSPHVEISNMKMYRKEGEHTIPISRDTYATEEAILYGAPFQASRFYLTVPEFNREQLLLIANAIAEDVQHLY